MPRNSSIDSAISSISNTSLHHPKSSVDLKDPSASDVRNLIATAGSAESLIQYLLKEKSHAAAQNAQLWKLVDKQRALLLGLNSDLERLTKEKEKYRKKLKELQPSDLPPPKTPPIRKDSQSPILGEVPIAVSTSTAANVAQMHPLEAKTPAFTGSSPMNPSLEPSHRQPAMDPASVPEMSPRSVPSQTSSPLNRNSLQVPLTPDSQGRSPNASPGPSPRRSRPVINTNFSQPQKPLPLQTILPAPSSNVGEFSPLSERSNKAFSANKKNAPAPLNLSQEKTENVPAQNLRSDSDRSGGQVIHNSPAPERGRRKTREDDDRDRALAAQQEQEARSKSKKAKLGETEQATEGEKSEFVKAAPVVGLPATPRLPVTMQPPTGNQNWLASSASLASVLHHPQSAITGPDRSFPERAIPERHLTIPVLSPGLPNSPRPMDRPPGSAVPRMRKDNNGNLVLSPMSARGMMPGLPLSPRAPRQPIPAKKESVLSPLSSRFNQRNTVDYDPSPTNNQESLQVDRSLVDSEHPGLLLPPNALPVIQIKVASSRLRPARNSLIGKLPDENPVFTLSVFSRHNSKELWRVEKGVSSLPILEHNLRSLCTALPALPDRKLFSGHAPAIIDARRGALNTYFDELLDTEMDERGAFVICRFLSSDVISSDQSTPGATSSSLIGRSAVMIGPDGKTKKQGYLTKRGKNFGGWKARFFVLESSEFRYYEAPGGPHLGTIKLDNAQIGKQQQSESPLQNEQDDENQFRHSFLILEPKRKDSAAMVRHVLCAENDIERDEWVEALIQYVNYSSEEDRSRTSPTSRAEDAKSHVALSEAKTQPYAPETRSHLAEITNMDGVSSETLTGINYSNTIAGAAPLIGSASLDRRPDVPSVNSSSTIQTVSSSIFDQDTSPLTAISSHGTVFSNPCTPYTAISSPYTAVSSPTNGSAITDTGAWGYKSPTQASFKESKRRGIFSFKQRQHPEMPTLVASPTTDLAGYGATSSIDRRTPVRAVFGLSLAEAVEYCPPIGVATNLPAVVYRCIEFLDAKNAAKEEGLFRLSGSNLVVKNLRDRFNSEGDVDLLAEGQFHDVHAVASLFKTYLRELPATVLTRELHIEFLQVIDLVDYKKKVLAFNDLVHRLPSVNYALLRAISGYLLEVVRSSETSKMSVRNVCIVFAPTLNIPAPVFTMFLTEFDAIFAENSSIAQSSRIVEVSVSTTLSPVDVRSPRHQIFSDLPTPGYNETTFPRAQPLAHQSLYKRAVARLQGSVDSAQDVDIRDYVSNIQTTQGLHRVPLPPNQGMAQPEYGSLNGMMA